MNTRITIASFTHRSYNVQKVRNLNELNLNLKGNLVILDYKSEQRRKTFRETWIFVIVKKTEFQNGGFFIETLLY